MAIISRGGRTIDLRQQQNPLQQGLAQAQQGMQFRAQQQLTREELQQLEQQFRAQQQLQEIELQQRMLWPIVQRRISQYGTIERAQEANDPIILQFLRSNGIKQNLQQNATDRMYQLREDSRNRGIDRAQQSSQHQQQQNQPTIQQYKTQVYPWFSTGENNRGGGGTAQFTRGEEGTAPQGIPTPTFRPGQGYTGMRGERQRALGYQAQGNATVPGSEQFVEGDYNQAVGPARTTDQRIEDNNTYINWAQNELKTNSSSLSNEQRQNMLSTMREKQEENMDLLQQERQQRLETREQRNNQRLRDEQASLRQQLNQTDDSGRRSLIENRLQEIDSTLNTSEQQSSGEETETLGTMETMRLRGQVLENVRNNPVYDADAEKTVDVRPPEEISRVAEELRERIRSGESITPTEAVNAIRAGDGPLVREGEGRDVSTWSKLLRDEDFMRENFPEIYQQQLALKNNELTNRQLFESVRAMKAQNALMYEDIYGDPNKLNETMVEIKREIVRLQRDQARAGIHYTDTQRELLAQQMAALKAQGDAQGVAMEVLLEGFEALVKAQESGSKGLQDVAANLYNMLLRASTGTDVTGSVPGQVTVQSGGFWQRLNPFQDASPDFQVQQQVGTFQNLDFNQFGEVPAPTGNGR